MRNNGPREANQTPEAARSPAKLQVAPLHRVHRPCSQRFLGLSFASQRNSAEALQIQRWKANGLIATWGHLGSGNLGRYSCVSPLPLLHSPWGVLG